MRLWESVADISFQELAPGSPSDLVVVRLEELKAAFGYTADYAGLSVVITESTADGETGQIAYVGLDRHTIPSFDPVRVAAHEVGHAFGFLDEPDADPSETLYSYVGSSTPQLGSRDIEEIQDHLGPSPRDDAIRHSEGAGRVRGGAGNDTIWGNGGRDLLYGNQGTDALSGGAGGDTLYGGQLDDQLWGGADADLVYGNRGSDTLVGGDGNDSLFGGQEDDWILGNDGDDVLFGNLGDDTLEGGPGADLFFVSDGDRVLDFNPAEGDRLFELPQAVTIVGMAPHEASEWVI